AMARKLAATGHEHLRFCNLSAATAAAIAASHGDDFALDSNRNYSDYIYSREALELLHGRHYQPKRNHINRFRSLYDFTVSPLCAADAGECMSLAEQWREDHHTQRSADAETLVLRRAFEAFGELELHGVALRVGSRMAAFSFGSYTPDGRMFCVHAEKADTTFEGVYAMVCNALVRSLDGGCMYINREEDLGIEGLRRSKLSWQPVDMVEKYTAVRLDDTQRQIRRLWQEVFGDPREFVDSFLVRYYSPELCAIRRDGERVAAMAHIVPMQTAAGRTAYIYAVATDPACRRRGLGRSVVEECIRRAREQGFDAVALIPSDEGLKSFYSALGFADTRMPIDFRSGFDLGTGVPDHDRAMTVRL
ncbi:MAG: GNAT family N-acetyltransferase, partial [Alistipes sp.]|nr:GNAT family N-acetyltransferase [Alistipes sp.]